jgi:hypothetical protein
MTRLTPKQRIFCTGGIKLIALRSAGYNHVEKELIDYMNKEYLESHKKVPIRVEMDEMGSFYQDKKHIWLW